MCNGRCIAGQHGLCGGVGVVSRGQRQGRAPLLLDLGRLLLEGLGKACVVGALLDTQVLLDLQLLLVAEGGAHLLHLALEGLLQVGDGVHKLLPRQLVCLGEGGALLLRHLLLRLVGRSRGARGRRGKG